jgi:hypothetical protein
MRADFPGMTGVLFGRGELRGRLEAGANKDEKQNGLEKAKSRAEGVGGQRK